MTVRNSHRPHRTGNLITQFYSYCLDGDRQRDGAGLESPQNVRCFSPHRLHVYGTRTRPWAAETRFSAPHFAHLLSIRVLPRLIAMALRFRQIYGGPYRFTRPEGKEHWVTYIVVVAFAADPAPKKTSPFERKELRVANVRIISIFSTPDLHAHKDVYGGPSYFIISEGELALFTALVGKGVYTLDVELENHNHFIFNVTPTPELFKAYEKWALCAIALMEQRTPKETQ